MATKNDFEILFKGAIDESSIRKEVKDLNGKFTLDLNIKTSGTGLTNVNKQIKEAQSNLGGLSDSVGKFLRWQLIGDVIHGVINSVRGMVDEVFELDSALVELQKVTDLSGESLRNYAQDAFEVAEQIGSTGKEVVQAATLFAQAGYTAQDALDLSKEATILTNVGDASATTSQSAQTLISTMKAFKIEAGDTTHVVDSLNEVSNKYAVSVNDLSKGVAVAGASLAQTDTSFEESLGLITAGTEILQNASKVSRGLTTISSRIRKGIDESGDSVEGLQSDIDSLIKTTTKGEGIFDSTTGELRSTYDVLYDLSKVWDTLKDTEQEELLSLIAGTNQRTTLNAVLSNFNSAIGATEAALNSEGSATEENNKRMQSLEGHVKQLSNAWQQLAATTIDSDFVKGLLDMATASIKFIDATGGIIPLLTSFMGILLAVNSQNLILKISNGITIMSNGFKILKQQIFGANNAQVVYMQTANGTNTALTATQAKAIAASTAFGLLTAAVSAVVMIFNAYNSAQEESSRLASESVSKELDNITSLQDLKKSYEDVMSSELEEEEKKIKLAEIQEKLNNLYKDNNLDVYADSLDVVTDKFKELTSEQLSNLKSTAGASSKGVIKDIKDATLNVKDIFFDQDLVGVYSDLGVYYKDIAEKIRALKAVQEEYANTQSKDMTPELILRNEKAVKVLGRLEGALEENKDNLDAYYSILQQGENLTQDQIDALIIYNTYMGESVYNLSNLDIETGKLTETTSENTDAIDNNAESKEVATKTTEELVKINDKLNENLDSLQSAYSTVSSAIDEYNKNGYLSIDTLQELLALNDGYLLSLVDENGQLQLNEQGYRALAEAQLNNAESVALNQAMSDLATLSSQRRSGSYRIFKK